MTYETKTSNRLAANSFAMKNAIRRIAVRLGYFLIRSGFTLPQTLSDMAESFQKAAYLRDVLKRLRINCVIDVGANVGESVSLLRRIGFRGYIFSFEPYPDSFKSLYSTFCTDPYWKGFNVALGSQNMVSDFRIAQSSYNSSFLTSKTVKTCRVADVQVKRLDSIIDTLLECIRDPRIFLKIDTQGYDLEVVRGAEGCKDRILCLQSEIAVTQVYDNMPNYLKSLAYYESLGFKLMNLFTVTRTAGHGAILEYDALMARPKSLNGPPQK